MKFSSPLLITEFSELFILAVWILAYGSLSGAPRSALAPLSLVLFPLLTGLPALVIALVALVASTLASKVRAG